MAFPLLGKTDFSTWTVGELAVSARGQKSAPVFADSKPCPHLQLCTVQNPMSAPFGASAYNDDGSATRLNMELNLSDEQCLQLGKLDDWARARATDLGLKGEFRPCVSVDKHGNRRIRVKVSTTGVHAAKFWDTMRTPLGSARDIALGGALVTPVVAVTKIWTMAGQWGLTCELRHGIVSLVSQECPDMM